jgi:hypothetical protein
MALKLSGRDILNGFIGSIIASVVISTAATLFNPEILKITLGQIAHALLNNLATIIFAFVASVAFMRTRIPASHEALLQKLEEQKKELEKNNEALRQIINGETTLRGVVDLRESIYKVTNDKFSDLEGRLKDEFYFIRLKSRVLARAPGGLDWDYKNSNNMGIDNQYTNNEKVELENHAWKFKK